MRRQLLEHLLLPHLVLRVGSTVLPLEADARNRDPLPDLRVHGGAHELHLRVIGVRGAQDHPVGRESDHLARLEVAQDQDESALDVLLGHVGAEAGRDGAGFVLPDVNLLAEELVGLLVLPDPGDATDADVEGRDGGTVVGVQGVGRHGGRRRRGLGRSCGVGLLLASLLLLLLRLGSAELLRDGIAKHLELLDPLFHGDKTSSVGVHGRALGRGHGDESHLLRHVLAAHLAGQGQTEGVEEMLALDAQRLGHGLHVDLVGLGVGIGITAHLIVLNDGLADVLEEGSEGIGRIGLGQSVGFEIADEGLGDGVEVPSLDHLLRLTVRKGVEGIGEAVSKDGLGVQGRILGGFHHLLGKGRGREDEIANLNALVALVEETDHVHLLADQIRHLLDGLHLEMLGVHPPQLVHVEDRGTFHHPIHSERLDEFVPGEDLVVGPVVPTQKSEVVDHGVRQEPVQAELVARRGAVPLGQLLLVLAQDQGAVRVPRAGGAQGVEDESLPQGVGQVLLGADDRSDAHGGVVDRDAEVVNGNPGRTEQDEITHGGLGVPGDGTAHRVVDHHPTARGHLEPHRERRALRHLFRNLLRIGVPPGTVVPGGNALRLLPRLHLVQFLLGAEAGVGLPFVDETLGDLGVEGGPLGLTVRTVLGPRHVRALVPVEAEPAEVGEDGLLGLPCRTRQIRVLDAKEEGAVLSREVELSLLGDEPVVQGRAGAADVKASRGTWSEPHPRRAVLHLPPREGENDLDIVVVVVAVPLPVLPPVLRLPRVMTQRRQSQNPHARVQLANLAPRRHGPRHVNRDVVEPVQIPLTERVRRVIDHAVPPSRFGIRARKWLA
mmetsp:Transcript_30905/g.63114  ORF Transcript_30905/g.63114 Transcript_30905/m.63114 type:complete len:834 (-) Transcript_30905:594-3095(-)